MDETLARPTPSSQVAAGGDQASKEEAALSNDAAPPRVDPTGGVGDAVRAAIRWLPQLPGEMAAMPINDHARLVAVAVNRTGPTPAVQIDLVSSTLPGPLLDGLLVVDGDRKSAERFAEAVRSHYTWRIDPTHVLALAEQALKHDDAQQQAPSTPPPTAAGIAPAARIVALADIVPEAVCWLWPGRIPLGKLTILDGDPGLGKSTLLLDIAARLSAGRPMPGETAARPPKGVVLLSAEDDLASTLRPRLEAAGADLARVVALQGMDDGDGSGERLPVLPDDLPAVRQAVDQVGAQLVVVDPIMAFLGERTNSARDSDVRRVLAPLARLAEETGVAVVAVRHLNKAPGGNPLYRGGGSIAFIGQARVGLLVAADPTATTRRVVAVTKSNVGPLPAALAFEVVPAIVDRPSGPAIETSNIRWLGPTDATAAALLAVQADDGERSELDDARAFLEDALADGPKPAVDVRAEARRCGVSEITLRRAKSALSVTASRVGGLASAGGWQWRLPEPKAINAPVETKVIIPPLDERLSNGDANTTALQRPSSYGAQMSALGAKNGHGGTYDAHLSALATTRTQPANSGTGSPKALIPPGMIMLGGEPLAATPTPPPGGDADDGPPARDGADPPALLSLLDDRDDDERRATGLWQEVDL